MSSRRTKRYEAQAGTNSLGRPALVLALAAFGLAVATLIFGG